LTFSKDAILSLSRRSLLIPFLALALAQMACNAVMPQRSATQTPMAPATVVFNIESFHAVSNGPLAPTRFTTYESWFITVIQTYHYNFGKGAPPGTIALRATNGALYGPWSTLGRDSESGGHNSFWVATPNITLPPDTYTIIDSDPSTWSYNSETNGMGFAMVGALPKNNP
jgi:hypothetical protein